MTFSRRQFIAVAGGVLAATTRAIASDRGALVIVRSDGSLFAVDPRTGDIDAWTGASLATPAPIETAALQVPDAVATPATEGAVSYWISSPGGDAFVYRLDTGASSSWWWLREGGWAVPLDLPTDLEPAFPSGTSTRWFHGATVAAAHLGAGTLRLLAIDIESGEIVLDHPLDRRLELAATKVSDDGAIVAHVQSSTTGVAFWAADLRDGKRLIEVGVVEEPGTAAASAIELDVAPDGDAALVVAGLTWAWPGAPNPAVTILWSAPPDVARTTTLPGVLIGIVDENSP